MLQPHRILDVIGKNSYWSKISPQNLSQIDFCRQQSTLRNECQGSLVALGDLGQCRSPCHGRVALGGPFPHHHDSMRDVEPAQGGGTSPEIPAGFWGVDVWDEG